MKILQFLSLSLLLSLPCGASTGPQTKEQAIAAFSAHEIVKSEAQKLVALGFSAVDVPEAVRFHQSLGEHGYSTSFIVTQGFTNPAPDLYTRFVTARVRFTSTDTSTPPFVEVLEEEAVPYRITEIEAKAQAPMPVGGGMIDSIRGVGLKDLNFR